MTQCSWLDTPTIRRHAPVCGLRPERFTPGRGPLSFGGGGSRPTLIPAMLDGQRRVAGVKRWSRRRLGLGLGVRWARIGSWWRRDRIGAWGGGLGLGHRGPRLKLVSPAREASRSSSWRRPPSDQSCRAAPSSSTPWVLSMEDGCYRGTSDALEAPGPQGRRRLRDAHSRALKTERAADGDATVAEQSALLNASRVGRAIVPAAARCAACWSRAIPDGFFAPRGLLPYERQEEHVR